MFVVAVGQTNEARRPQRGGERCWQDKARAIGVTDGAKLCGADRMEGARWGERPAR